MQALGSDGGEAGVQIEAHLLTEYAACAHPGAVPLVRAVVTDVAYEIQILFHGRNYLLRVRRDRAGMVGGVVSAAAANR